MLLAVALAGCGGSSSFSDWPGPPQAAPNGSVPVDSFNSYLGDYEDYATSPEALATEFLKLEDVQTVERSMSTAFASESGNRAKVTVQIDLLDDSVRSEQYELAVTRGQKGWRLNSARRTIACREGRGHSSYSVAPCF